MFVQTMAAKKYDLNGKKRNENYFQRWLAAKSTPEKAVQLLNKLEDSGYRWQCTIRGYQQIKPIKTVHYLVGLTLDILGIITIVKGILIMSISDLSIRIMLGDLFTGSPVDNIQVSLITTLLILAVGLRYIGFKVERQGPLKSLTLYHRLRIANFNHKQFMLTSTDCSNLRKVVYFFTQVAALTPLPIYLGIAIWLIFALLINPVNYQNAANTFTTGFWTLTTILIFIPTTITSFWLYSHISIMVAFVTFSLQSLQKFGHSIIKHSGKNSRQRGDIYKYFAQQNRLYNLIGLTTIDLGQALTYGILVVSGTANFALFVSIFVGTGSNLFDYIILTVGLLSLNFIVVVNVLSAYSAHKVFLCSSVNYKLARRCKLDTISSLKFLATCERMNTHKIGFTFGGIFTLDSEHFLLYLLENAGLMLMFITNFNKATNTD